MFGLRWIFKRDGASPWIGYQDKIQAGFLEHKEHAYIGSDGLERCRTQVRVTGKGLLKLADIVNQPVH